MFVVLVVAAAIVRDGRVLAARRTRPAHLAGGWEFPGGKVEDDEAERDALRRECREELAIDLLVGDRLGTEREGELRLVLYRSTLATGEPTAGADHGEVRWLASDELEDVAWLPIDRALLPAVRATLINGGATAEPR